MGGLVRSKVENGRGHVFWSSKATLGDGSSGCFSELLWIGLSRQPCLEQGSLSQARATALTLIEYLARSMAAPRVKLNKAPLVAP